MTRLALLATLCIAAAYVALRRKPSQADPDPYAEPVPMAAWDGTAIVTHTGNNAATIRVRWTPTRTEVV